MHRNWRYCQTWNNLICTRPLALFPNPSCQPSECLDALVTPERLLQACAAPGGRCSAPGQGKGAAEGGERAVEAVNGAGEGRVDAGRVPQE